MNCTPRRWISFGTVISLVLANSLLEFVSYYFFNYYIESPIIYLTITAIILCIGLTSLIYYSKDIPSVSPKAFVYAVLLSTFTIVVSLSYYATLSRYQGSWREPSSHERAYDKVFLLCTTGIILLVIIYSFLKRILNQLNKEAIHSLCYCIRYPFLSLIGADFILLLIKLLFEIFIPTLNIEALPYFVYPVIMFFWVETIGEVLLTSSLLGLSFTFLLCYLIFKRMAELESKHYTFFKLFIVIIPNILYGLLIGIVGMWQMPRSYFDTETFITIAPGVAEYVLIFLWYIVIIGFTLSTIYLHNQAFFKDKWTH